MMNIPPAPAPAMQIPAAPKDDKITLTCRVCFKQRQIEAGERDTGCECQKKPETPIFVYRLMTAGNGFGYHAIAYPIGQRVLTAYGDSETKVRRDIERLLSIG